MTLKKFPKIELKDNISDLAIYKDNFLIAAVGKRLIVYQINEKSLDLVYETQVTGMIRTI